MSTTYDTDPSTTTFAAAWASSPLGDPMSGPTELEETVELAGAPAPADKPNSIARHAVVAAALAVGIGGAAALGLAMSDYTDPAQPTVAVPGVSAPGGSVPNANQPVTPNGAVPAPASVPAPQGDSGSGPVASIPEIASAPNVGPSSNTGSGTTDVGSLPAGDPGGPVVVIDIPIPPLPEPQPQPEPDPPPDPPSGPTDVTLQQAPADPPMVQEAPVTVTKVPPSEKPIIKIQPPGMQFPGKN